MSDAIPNCGAFAKANLGVFREYRIRYRSHPLINLSLAEAIRLGDCHRYTRKQKNVFDFRNRKAEHADLSEPIALVTVATVGIHNTNTAYSG